MYFYKKSPVQRLRTLVHLIQTYWAFCT